MSGKLLAISIGYTTASLIGLLWRSNLVLSESLIDGSVAGDDGFQPGQNTHILELLLGSNVTVMLLVNLMFAVFFTAILSLKMLFFGRLSIVETRKTMEHLINYVIHKGIFLPLIVHPELFHGAFWTTWFMVLCCLKFFEVLAKERLEHLNASPSSTPWMCFRVYLVLLLVLFADLFWIIFCVSIYKASESSLFLLLLFEPLGVVFETMRAIMVHGLQLIETYNHCSVDRDGGCHGNQLLSTSGLGSLLEWKGILIRNFGFLMDVLALLMALGHYIDIWWFHGPSFHVVDAMLVLNLGGLLATLVKRVKGFIKLRLSMKILQGALPDATSAEIVEYNDECAICKEPMVSAKKLTCNHLFHLSCLRAWLDQGVSEAYSCPTCRRPLVNYQVRQVAEDEQLARRMSSAMYDTISGHEVEAAVHNQQEGPRNSLWRVSPDSSWENFWPNAGLDGAGPSAPVIRSTGLGGVQMMMRNLAAVSGIYANAFDDSSWSLWPTAQSQMAAGVSLPRTSSRRAGNFRGLRIRNPLHSGTENLTSLLSMVETVREVLPHIPHEIILQDLQQTHCVTVTVNNLLHL